MKTYYSQTNAALDYQLNALKTDFLQSLPNRIERLLQSWKLEKSSSENIQATYEQAHSLAGNATIFGCLEVSVIAREIKNHCIQFNNGEISRKQAHEAIQRLLGELQNSATHNITQALKTPGSGENKPASRTPLVYIAEPDLTTSGELIYFISSTGYQVETFETIQLLDQAVRKCRPDVILVSLTSAPQEQQHHELLSSLGKTHSIPLIILGKQDNLEMRLHAIRSGAYHYIVTPPDLPMLIHTLDRLTRKLEVNAIRAYLVENRKEHKQDYGKELEKLGVDVKYQCEAEIAVVETREFRPDVIVIDIQDKHISSTELASLIRQDDDFEMVPIVFLGDISTEHNRLKSIYPGVNTLLKRSDSAKVLARAIMAQAEHARTQQNSRASLHMTFRQLEYLQNAIDEHAIIAMTDDKGNITYVNHKFAEVSGYPAHELLGKNHSILKSGVHSDEFYRGLWKTITSGNVWHGTLTNRAKNGNLYDVDTTIVPKLNSEGLPEAYIAIRTDITEIKSLQRRVGEEMERLSLALEATQSGMWEWNLNSNLVIYGPRWVSMMGYNPDERLSWPMLIHADDLGKVIAALLNHVDGQTPLYESEHRLKFADGSWHWVRETGRIIEYDEDHAPVRLVGTTQIIDDRIALEQQQRDLQDKLLHAAKMESIGQLTAGIAHDFNNLLGGILGFTELSMEVLESPKNIADVKNYLSQVLAAGSRAKELISQMLLFSRLSPETGIDNAPNILLRPVIAEVTFLAQSSIPSGITINFQVEDENIKARIQPVHLHQILLNLVLNARDAIGEFGNISITSSNKSLKGVCGSCHHAFDDKFVEIAVHDTGKGIKPDKLNKIFEPFYSTKAVGKGSGMGLSVTHGIVHALNGHLSVDSSAEHGTTFKIYLPIHDELHTGKAKPIMTSIERKKNRLYGTRVMVVDDEITITNMIADFIELNGGKVRVHNKPDKALADFIKHPDDYDLLITDATMPGISGLELARAILQLKPKLPILMCTGYSSYVNEDIARRNGITGFMKKPVELLSIMNWIQKQRPAS